MSGLDFLPGRLDVSAIAGDSIGEPETTWTFEDDEGNPIDLTGATFDAKLCKGDETPIDWNLSVVGDPADGVVAPDLDTSSLEGRYDHHVTITTASGQVRTWLVGRVDITVRKCE